MTNDRSLVEQTYLFQDIPNNSQQLLLFDIKAFSDQKLIKDKKILNSIAIFALNTFYSLFFLFKKISIHALNNLFHLFEVALF